MKKRILSILLSLTMLLSLVPAMGITAWAGQLLQDVCKIGETNYPSITAALTAAHTDESTENPTVITLIGDVSENVIISGDNPDTEEVDETRYITLDLNGFVLKGDGSNSVIINGGVLTIKDSDSTKEHKYVVGSNGLWTWNDNAEGSAKAYESLTARPEEGDVITVKGGAITGGIGKDEGGIYCGGGVYNTGSLTVTGVNFVGNSATSGGGIYNKYNGSFSISGGSITGNYAYNSGGGIYNGDHFTATDCDISHNTTVTGGGIYNSSSGTLTVTGGSITDNTATENGGGIYILYASYCFAEGTKITMADGSTENIEDISVGDYVKSFNHETGAYESNRVILAYEGERAEKYFTLHFSDGTDLSVCGGHDLFEQGENRYVTVSKDNYSAYIGKYFYNASTGAWEKLLSVTNSSDAKKYYSVYVAKTFNCLANGMLSVPDDDLHLDIYTFNADLTVNQAALQADIAKYGICKLEDCHLITTQEEYEALGIKYYNILLGKGIATAEEIREVYYEWYADGEQAPSVLTAKSVQNDAPYTLTASLVQYEEEETASLTVGGTAKITGNTADGKANNVYLCDGKYIAIADTNIVNASIGVTLNTGTGKFTTNGTSTDAQYFTSDNAAYYVNFNTNHFELLEKMVCKIGGIEYVSIAAALEAAHTGESAENPTVITLIDNDVENVVISGDSPYTEEVEETRYITLDLNGFVLSGTGSGSVITNSGTLTVKDTSTGNNTHYFVVGSNGLWTWDDNAEDTAKAYESLTARPEEGDVITVQGGAITGGVGDSGHGILNQGNAVLTIEGGNIIGNKNTNGYGAAIYTDNSCMLTLKNGRIIGNYTEYNGSVCADGEFLMENGDISFNTVGAGGGAVCVESATFNMKDGTLRFNKAGYYGGAVDCSVGSFHMYGGTISGNKAAFKGGAVNNGMSVKSFHMHGGTITDNKAGDCGGGVFSESNDCTFDGKCIVSGNTAGNDNHADNVYLSSSQTVQISNGESAETYTGKGELLKGSSIGVTTMTAPTEGNPVAVTVVNTADNSSRFFADNKSEYHIEYDTTANRVVLVFGKTQEQTFSSVDDGSPAVKTKKACAQDSTCVYAKFSDADPKEWYHDGVHFCVENGCMNGIGNDKFAPSGTLSRAMIVTILWRIEGSPVVNYAMSFADVANDFWYTESIRWAQSTGVVTGYDETGFGPENNVTREQLAAILYRYAQLKGKGFTGASMFYFNPIDRSEISSWASEPMRWCYMHGILTGDDTGALHPTDSSTRAQAACMVQRFCMNVVK